VWSTHMHAVCFVSQLVNKILLSLSFSLTREEVLRQLNNFIIASSNSSSVIHFTKFLISHCSGKKTSLLFQLRQKFDESEFINRFKLETNKMQ